jgi:hypothetical protein
MTEPGLVPGPIYGLRTWRVVGTPGHERLAGPHRTALWPSGGALLEAECSVTPVHEPPGATCACGLHAWHPTRAAARRVWAVRREVPGILEASGAVEVHADGFRAQRGRPHALVLLPNGNAPRLQRLAESYDLEVLRLDGPDALMAHCRERGLGLSEGAVAELVDTVSLAAARRERRRRGMVTAIVLTAVLLALGALAVVVDPGVEHGKTLNGRTGEFRVP